MAAFTNAARTQQFAMALYGIQLGTVTIAAVQDDIANNGGFNNTINSYFAYSFGSLPTATVAANLVQNVGITTGAADAITYVKAILDTTPAASRGVAVEGILNAFSKMTGDAVYGAAATYYNNRLTTALNYTGATDVAVGTASPAQIVTLTTGADVFGGTSGDDSYLAAENTLNPLDVINGGAGNNTLKVALSEDTANDGDQLKGVISNIQNLVYVGDASTIELSTINASKVGGLQTVVFSDVDNLNDDTDIINLQSGATVRVEGSIGSYEYELDQTEEAYLAIYDPTGDSDTLIVPSNEDYLTQEDWAETFDNNFVTLHATYAKDATVANLVLNNAKVTDTYPEGGEHFLDYAAIGTSTDTLKTLNVSGNTSYTSATNNTTVDLLTDDAVNKITTLNVNSYAGGTLKIDASDNAGNTDGLGKNLTTIDATASAGKTIIDITGYPKDLTYKGGAADDILIMDLDKLDAKDSIVGGAGVDQLWLNLSDVDNASSTINGDTDVVSISVEGYNFINDTGFETISFGNNGDTDVAVASVDMSKLTSSSVRMTIGLAASKVLDTDTFSAAGTETFTLAHARSVVGPEYAYTGNGVVNASVGAGKTLTVTEVVLDINNASGGIVAATGKSDFAKLVLSGDGNVIFDNHGASSADTAGGATVDASAMTGTSSLTYTGNANQTDYVTLGAGSDTVVISGSTTTLYDRVTGFGKTDLISLIDTDIDLAQWMGKLTIDSGVTTVSGAIANAVEQLATERAGYFQFGGNTYVVEDGSSADYAIQLVGTLTLTSSNIDFA